MMHGAKHKAPILKQRFRRKKKKPKKQIIQKIVDDIIMTLSHYFDCVCFMLRFVSHGCGDLNCKNY